MPITSDTKKTVIITNNLIKVITDIELFLTPVIHSMVMEEIENCVYKEEIKAFINNVYNKAVTGE